MSDPTNSYGIQVSTTVNGDLWNVRGDDAEELHANLKGLADNANEVHEALTTFKQAGVAHGVFTGNAPPENPPAALEPARSAGSPPPTGEAPRCEGGHGPMKDFGPPGDGRKRNKKNEPYKYRYYCSSWGSDCKPRD